MKKAETLEEHMAIVKTYIYGLKKISKETNKIKVSNSGHSNRDYSKKKYASYDKMTATQFLFEAYPYWSDKKMTILKHFVCNFYEYVNNIIIDNKNDNNKDDNEKIMFNIKDLNPKFTKERLEKNEKYIYDRWPNNLVNCLPEIFTRIGKNNYAFDYDKSLSFFNGNCFNINNFFKLIVYRNRLYDYICYLDWYDNNHYLEPTNLLNWKENKHIEKDNLSNKQQNNYEKENDINNKSGEKSLNVIVDISTPIIEQNSFEKIIKLAIDIIRNDSPFKQVNEDIKNLLENHTESEIDLAITDIEDVLSIIKSKKI